MEVSGASGGSPTGCGKQAGLNSARPTSKIFRLLRTSSGRCSSSSSSPRSLLWPGAAGESSAAADFSRRFAFAWLIFFVFSPGIGAQYLIWLAPFILLLSPRFYTSYTAGSTLFLFFFYNTISGGLPWYYGMSNGQRDSEWVPWSNWPWMILAVGLVLFYRKMTSDEAEVIQRRSRVTCSVADWSALPRRSALNSIVSWSRLCTAGLACARTKI